MKLRIHCIYRGSQYIRGGTIEIQLYFSSKCEFRRYYQISPLPRFVIMGIMFQHLCSLFIHWLLRNCAGANIQMKTGYAYVAKMYSAAVLWTNTCLSIFGTRVTVWLWASGFSTLLFSFCILAIFVPLMLGLNYLSYKVFDVKQWPFCVVFLLWRISWCSSDIATSCCLWDCIYIEIWWSSATPDGWSFIDFSWESKLLDLKSSFLCEVVFKVGFAP